MEDLRGRVAVVTGAASGIGRALARRAAAEGMRVVMADIEVAALEKAAAALATEGADVCSVPTDVSRPESVEALARQTLDAFGGVHLVCNNAGVISGGLTWESPLSDYEWMMGVNVWGVVHGIRTFVPLLLEQGVATHVVNTSSMAGLTAMPFAGIYHMTKHAVLALSESLYHELRAKGSQVGVSVLCPEGVATEIHHAERNRPAELAGVASQERALIDASLAQLVENGVAPDVLADRTFAAIREDRFYVLAEDAWRDAAHQRMDDIRAGRNPVLRPPV